MKKILGVVLVLMLALMSIFALTACNNDDYRNPTAGSTVREVASEEISEPTTAVYNSFKEFKRSEFGKAETLFGDSYTKVFYNKQYFEDQKLIVTKFNDTKGNNYFIQSISEKDDEIAVNLVRFAVENAGDAKATYGLFLETPTSVNATKVKLNIVDVKGSFAQRGIYSTMPDVVEKMSVITATSKDELATALGSDANDNTIISIMVNTYNDEFFTKNDLIAINAVMPVTAREYACVEDGKVIIDSYMSSHYANAGEVGVTNRRLIFVPIAKGDAISSVVLNEHAEADFNDAKAIITTKIDINE